jgi:hypothetical protein
MQGPVMADVGLFSEGQKVRNWRRAYVRLVALFYIFQGFYHLLQIAPLD